MEIQADVLFPLLDLAYAAAQGGRGWEPFLLAVADTVEGRSAVLLQHDLSHHGGLIAMVRVEPDQARLYNEHFHTCDPFASSAIARSATAGAVLSDEMCRPRLELARTEYFNDYARKFDITRIVTAVLHKDAAITSALTITRGDRDAPFGQPQRHLLSVLAPHIRRALDIYRRLHTSEQTERLMSDVFDLLPTPALLVDRLARVVRANRRAELLLARNDGLSTRDRALVAETNQDTSRLQAACAGARQGLGAAGATLNVARRSTPIPLRLIIAPVGPADPLSVDDSHSCALVLIDEPDVGSAPSVGMLRQLYRLTATEADIAARIAVGQGLDEIAATRGCSLQTVQWHNKRILSKVGCRTRSELVRQLTLSLASMIPGD